ncbi:MAG: DoxX family membrane protein [Calditrichia bacterium]
MEVLFFIGRLMAGGFYIYNSFNHFSSLNMMAAFADSKGVPAPKAAVLISGLFLLLGGISIITGVFVITGIILIALFLLIVSFYMHAFWKIGEEKTRRPELINFAKNMALLGSALMFLAIPRPWPFSL